MAKGKKGALQSAVNGLDTQPLVGTDPPAQTDLSKAFGADADGDGDDDEDGDGDDDEDDDMGKSLPSESDLLKAMSALEQTANVVGNGGSLRKSDLAARMAAGEQLSKSEKEELRALLDGEERGDVGGYDLSKSHRERFVEEPAIEQGLELSPFLDAQNAALCKSLDGLTDALRGMQVEQNTVNAKLAKGLVAIGTALAGMSKRVAQLEGLNKSLTEQGVQPQPARGATRVGQPFNENRGFAGQQPGGEPMNKSLQADRERAQHLTQKQIGDSLEALVKSTEQAGPKGFGQLEGVDLLHATAMFEQTRRVPPSAMRLVLKHNNINPAAVGL